MPSSAHLAMNSECRRPFVKRIISNCGNQMYEALLMNSTEIVVDPKIMMGKPVIAGTRITVELILDKLAAGETIEQILEDFPSLTRDSVLAALAYASEGLKSIIVHPAEAISE